ncbi:Replicase polyprotein [Paramyrothecium foliicola]|nr:Replicase polyprotein [Paramyrothecium foliicola]
MSDIVARLEVIAREGGCHVDLASILDKAVCSKVTLQPGRPYQSEEKEEYIYVTPSEVSRVYCNINRKRWLTGYVQNHDSEYKPSKDDDKHKNYPKHEEYAPPSHNDYEDHEEPSYNGPKETSYVEKDNGPHYEENNDYAPRGDYNPPDYKKPGSSPKPGYFEVGEEVCQKSTVSIDLDLLVVSGLLSKDELKDYLKALGAIGDEDSYDVNDYDVKVDPSLGYPPAHGDHDNDYGDSDDKNKYPVAGGDHDGDYDENNGNEGDYDDEDNSHDDEDEENREDDNEDDDEDGDDEDNEDNNGNEDEDDDEDNEDDEDDEDDKPLVDLKVLEGDKLLDASVGDDVLDAEVLNGDSVADVKLGGEDGLNLAVLKDGKLLTLTNGGEDVLGGDLLNILGRRGYAAKSKKTKNNNKKNSNKGPLINAKVGGKESNPPGRLLNVDVATESDKRSVASVLPRGKNGKGKEGPLINAKVGGKESNPPGRLVNVDVATESDKRSTTVRRGKGGKKNNNKGPAINAKVGGKEPKAKGTLLNVEVATESRDKRNVLSVAARGNNGKNSEGPVINAKVGGKEPKQKGRLLNAEVATESRDKRDVANLARRDHVLSHYQPLCKKGFKKERHDEAHHDHADDVNKCLGLCHAKAARETHRGSEVIVCAAVEFTKSHDGDNCFYFVAPESKPCHDDELEDNEDSTCFYRN